MGFSVSIQGILQSLGYAVRPLIISLLRLVIFVFPVAYLFTLSNDVTNIVWWTFPIAEVATAIISIFILKKSYKEKIEKIETAKISKTAEKLVISISREHGTNGKEIARKVAEQLGVKFYDKEEMKRYAVSRSLASNSHTDDELYKFYLSLDAEKDSIIKQAETIKSIAEEENCIIVGRASDYILRDNPNLIRIFLYAPLEYRINKVKEVYKDTYKEAKKHVLDSDKSRSSYYEVISNQPWGRKENYDLCINCEIGNDKIVKVICEYIENKKQ